MGRFIVVVAFLLFAGQASAEPPQRIVNISGDYVCAPPEVCMDSGGCEAPATCQAGYCRYGTLGEYEVECCYGTGECTTSNGERGACVYEMGDAFGVCITARLYPTSACFFVGGAPNFDCVAGDGAGEMWVPRWGGEPDANCDRDECSNEVDMSPCDTGGCPIDAGVDADADADVDAGDPDDAGDADARDATADASDGRTRDAMVDDAEPSEVADASVDAAEAEPPVVPGRQLQGGGTCSTHTHLPPGVPTCLLALTALVLGHRRRKVRQRR